MKFTVIVTPFIGVASDRAVKEARESGSTPLLFDSMTTAETFYNKTFRNADLTAKIRIIGEFTACVEEEAARQAA